MMLNSTWFCKKSLGVKLLCLGAKNLTEGASQSPPPPQKKYMDKARIDQWLNLAINISGGKGAVLFIELV